MMASLLVQSFCLLAVIFVSQSLSLECNPCGNWIAYKDEKCVKFVDQSSLQNKEDAEIICKTLGQEIHDEDVPKLVTIKTEEKQRFLQKLLFENVDIIENIWLGLDLGNKSIYHWNDGTDLNYTNWAKETYTDHERNCVQMESGEGVYESGKWSKVYCKKRNAVVCEKTQPLTVTALQNILLSMKSEMEKNKLEIDQKILQVEKHKQEADEEIAILKNITGVPIGFVYIQLSGQQSPEQIWPTYTWKDVSSSYAGLFFRVVGGNSSAFGETQEANSTRLDQVWYTRDGSYINPLTIPLDGTWSNKVYSGAASGPDDFLKFRMSGGEIRPRNQAVKVWQRTK